MKLVIKDSGTNSYYDEYLFLVQNYKKVHSDSNIKIKKSSSSAYFYLCISIIIFIGSLIWYLLSNDAMQLCVLGLFSVSILLSIILLYLTKKRISTLSNSHQKTIFEITKDGVKVENKDKKFNLKFDEIKKILIGNYTITFIPNDITKNFITTRIEFKEDITKALKKYKKDNLIK